VEPIVIPGDACRDPEDIPILGAAVGGAAGLLVTVDKDLLSLEQFRGIPINQTGGFLERALPARNENWKSRNISEVFRMTRKVFTALQSFRFLGEIK